MKNIEKDAEIMRYINFILNIYSHPKIFLIFNLTIVIIQLFFQIDKIKVFKIFQRFYIYKSQNFTKIRKDKFQNKILITHLENLINTLKKFIFEEKKFEQNFGAEQKEDVEFNNFLLNYIVKSFEYLEIDFDIQYVDDKMLYYEVLTIFQLKVY